MTTSFTRTVLAVPASSERFLAKAQRAAASALMVDLEDGVAELGKEAARGLFVQAAPLLADRRRGLWLRVNAVDTAHLDADLAAAADAARHLDALVLPKATPKAIDRLADRSNLPVVALIETAEGVEHAWTIAAHPFVRAVMFGELDYRSELAGSGGLHAHDTSWAQARIVNAAAGAAIAAIAGPTTAIGDIEQLRADCARQAALGFAGKLCIHPTQLDPVEAAFGPSAEMVAWACRVVNAAGEAPDSGAITVDGAMVDRPVIDRGPAHPRGDSPMSTSLALDGPYGDDFEIGRPLPTAPAITIDEGVAALYQAISGDPARLSLSGPLSQAVTGRAKRVVNSALALQIAIGQSTVATRIVIANLFYRDVTLHRQVPIGTTLTSTVTPVARAFTRDNGKGRRAKILLSIDTRDEHGHQVASLERLALLPVRDQRAGWSRPVTSAAPTPTGP
ncbi:aldolase/citrate lyase family protein [Streptomyces sp. GTA36]